MSAQPEPIKPVVEGVTWEKLGHADDATLKARSWNSDLFAAFRVARAYYAETYGEKLREVYGCEWAKVITQAFEVYAALIDAAEDDEDDARRKSRIRRFPLKAYRAAEYLTGKPVPFIGDPDAFAKRRASLERLWSRSGWVWVDRLQKVTGDALCERTTPGFEGNKGSGESTFYTERFSDLLTETIRAARRSRARRVNKFRAAFVEALRTFRREGQLPKYAPEWKPPPSEQEQRASATVRAYRAAPLAYCLAAVLAEEAKRPEVKAREMIARVYARAFTLLGEDEAAKDALQIEAHAWLDEIREGEELSAAPVCPPCVSTADSSEQDATLHLAPEPEFVARASEGVCDFPAENDKTAEGAADIYVRREPPAEVLEFEPEPEPRGLSMSDADATLTACASVGIDKYLAVFLDDTITDFEESCTFSEYGDPRQFRARLDGYLKRNQARRESLSVRLRFKGEFKVMQLDDCPPEALKALAPYSFLQVATSPGNGQAWIALADELDEDGYKALRYRLFSERAPLGKLKVNGGAHGSVRWPGSLNCKPSRRYRDGEPPRVQLLRAALGLKVSVAELEAAGLLGAAPPKPDPRVVREIRGRLPKGWPDLNDSYAQFGRDRSRAEFVWCMKALRRGWPSSHVEAELASLGVKASARARDSYIRDTVANAARIVGVDLPHSGVVEVTL